MNAGGFSIRKPARLLVVDDHPLIREGLSARISSQQDMTVCGEAADAGEALRAIKESCPDLALVDLALRDSHGLELIKDIKSHCDHTKILVVSAYEETLYAERALRAGADGYINKQQAQETVLDAIRTVLDGKRYLSETMTQRLVAQAIGGKDDDAKADLVRRLSDRELEVFELIGRGKATGAIARQLHLSVHTIDSHRENIRRKLNLKNGAELVRRAVEWLIEAR